MEIDKEANFLPSGPYLNSFTTHLWWFKIITPIQTNYVEEPNTRGGKGALTSDHEARQTYP
jgi:hypothetical protein